MYFWYILKSLIVIISSVFYCACLIAQTERLCSTDNYYPNTISVAQKNTSDLKIEFANTTNYHNILSNTKICLPVVVNNVYETQDQKISKTAIEQQIEQLNKDFNSNYETEINVNPYFESLIANIGIEFYLIDNNISEEEEQSGINYYKTLIDTFNMNGYPNIKSSSDNGLTGFNTKNYINIWVGNIEAGIKGYASIPNTTTATRKLNDGGIVIHYNNFGGNNKTLTHEMGHFLGLNHLFGLQEGVCDSDDDVTDTPQTATAYKTCISQNLVVNRCNDPYFEFDLTENFMNLCNDECLNMFTNGQKVKMLYNLLTYRKLLLKNNCNVLPNNKVDISLLNLNNVPIICNNELNLKYEICNVGRVDITGFNFELRGLLNEKVEVSIAPNKCIDYNQKVDLSKIRFNTFTAQINNVNNSKEEQNLENNIAIFDFRKASLIDLPFEEDFSNENSWLIAESTEQYNWVYMPKEKANLKNACYAFKPHPQNKLSIGSLYSPVFKLENNVFGNTNSTKIHTISFDAAYIGLVNNFILDYLFIEYNNACTDSTYQLLQKVNLVEAVTNLNEEQLLTQTNNTGWKNFTYNFETDASVTDLNLKLTYVSSNNNKLFLDNFKISTNSQTPLNIQNYINENKAGFYPNPATNGTVHFYAERYKGQFALVNIFNQFGQLQKKFQLNNYEELDVSLLPNGHYYITFNWSNKIVTEKLLLLK